MNIQYIKSGGFYSYAYWYFSKPETNVYHSSGHPPLEKLGSPRTKKCIAALKSKSCRAGTLSGGESSSLTCCTQVTKHKKVPAFETVTGYTGYNYI